MSHEIRVALDDLTALAAAVKELHWYTSTEGGYILSTVVAEAGVAVWTLASAPTPAAMPDPKRRRKEPASPGRLGERRCAEPGDVVLVETKGQQLSRRFGGGAPETVEGTVFRVLTRGPHPHGMKVELRDRSVGRVKRNLTMPGAGEPERR